jgi:hypothetical protein
MHLKCIIAILLLFLTGVGQKSAAQQKGKATFYAKRLNSTPPWQILRFFAYICAINSQTNILKC